MTRKGIHSAVVLGAALFVMLLFGEQALASDAKLSHGAAVSQLSNNGIAVTSSGGCSDRDKSNCTSLEQVRQDSITGIIRFKSWNSCAITVTGGTETGHATGEFSHWNGYKLDIRMTSCVTNYITTWFTRISNQDGYARYQSSTGNIYKNELNHWDILFYNDGASGGGGCVLADSKVSQVGPC